ncbi:hypothetical protein KOY48_04745 [Candidatus Minimicrobia naudis]|uniref:Uncharacterized protein n=1 Tax=Candidatus Minimicrobia naudis TaxID=2841263 RepID=A0A8F1MCR5_9BACT|nr:hypothetical protein KOY48_04745 [Candidatus Minimicrobia naudis]
MSAIPRQLPVITKPRAAACYNGVHGQAMVEVVRIVTLLVCSMVFLLHNSFYENHRYFSSGS